MKNLTPDNSTATPGKQTASSLGLRIYSLACAASVEPPLSTAAPRSHYEEQHSLTYPHIRRFIFAVDLHARTADTTCLLPPPPT